MSAAMAKRSLCRRRPSHGLFDEIDCVYGPVSLPDQLFEPGAACVQRTADVEFW
jgi:hypothetical protein